MSSIGSTLNSINTSLLSEISSLNASQTSSSTSSASSATSTDSVNFSQVAKLMRQLRQVQQSNPTEFKQVMSDAATNLKDAATQTTDTQEAAALNDLASRFQSAADTGSLSSLVGKSVTDSSSVAATSGVSAYAAHHHHHGGGDIASVLSRILGGSFSGSS